jgi:hypothetical protein
MLSRPRPRFSYFIRNSDLPTFVVTRAIAERTGFSTAVVAKAATWLSEQQLAELRHDCQHHSALWRITELGTATVASAEFEPWLLDIRLHYLHQQLSA